MIEDLDAEAPEASRSRIARPRVSSEPTRWAFLSALGAGFIANGIAAIALAVVWPVLLPPTQSHPEWLTPFAVSRAAQLVAVGAIALRAGGLPALGLCAGYEVALVIGQLPTRIAICERLGPQPDQSMPCGLPDFAAGTWPTWLALLCGALGSRWLMPSPMPGTNSLLRAAGGLTFALAIAAYALEFGQPSLFNGLAALGQVDPALGSRDASYLAVVSTMVLFVNLIVGLLAGLLLRRASSAAVLLVALLIGYDVGLGVIQVKTNVETGVPHGTVELAYLQAMHALRPAASVLGIAVGRLLVAAKRTPARPPE